MTEFGHVRRLITAKEWKAEEVQKYPQRKRRLATGYSQLFFDVEVSLELLDRALHLRIFFDFSLNGLRRMNHRGMITAAEFVSDRRKRCLGIFAT